jgi:N-carbamoyl-L-amino-acid hydrolase
LSFDKIWELFHEIEKEPHSSIEWYNHYVQKSITGATPALTDKSIQEKIVRATKSLNLTYKQMQSGAGHDSQDMALIAPIGMIFVPSVAGISHSQKSLAKQLIWRMERTYCFKPY